MENSELRSAISATGQGDAAAEEPVRLRKVVLFLVEDAVYAFDADEVKEVVLAGEIYPIPFVPAYVSGLINRHGEPHTVIDLKAVLGGGRLDASRVLIMNNGSDQISFLITDIDKIAEIPEPDVVSLPATDGGALFKGSFRCEGREVFIINPQEIYDRLGADIKSV